MTMSKAFAFWEMASAALYGPEGATLLRCEVCGFTDS